MVIKGLLYILLMTGPGYFGFVVLFREIRIRVSGS
jgi:hypothetical protein